MQIVETTNEGLKRGYGLTIPATTLDDRVEAEIKRIAPQVRMPGFRPGKVPANLVRKMHGERLHAEAAETAIRESVDELMREKQLRPSMQPSVELEGGYERGKDLALKVELEVLPEVSAPDTSGLALERLTVPVEDAQIDETLERIAAGNTRYDEAAKSYKAKDGDQLIIDFTGRLGDEPFEGGAAEDAALVLGSNQFIPGFEEQLVGVKTGDEKTITVTFPEDYPAEHLKGQEASFDVTVKAVKKPGEAKIDDEFAKNLGFDDLGKLRDIVRTQLEQETAGLTRTAMKRSLLDQLAAGHDFAVPQNMVDAEFEGIWQQLMQEAAGEDDPEAAKAEIEAEKDDYRRIAERRVRLGLLLSAIGQENDVQITQQEMQSLIMQAAQQYRPEDRERFMQYVQSEPMAAAQLRAPLYEDKVVDFLFDKADVTEREVTRDELQAAIEAEEGEAGTAKAKPKTAKKTAAKKKPAKADADKADGDDAGTGQADAATADEVSAEAPAKPKKAPAKKKAAESQEPVEATDDGKAPAKKAGAKKPAAKSAADGGETPAKKPAAKKKAPAKKADKD